MGRILRVAAAQMGPTSTAETRAETLSRQGKTKMFNVAGHRQPAHYDPITERAGVLEPAVLDAI